MSRHFRIREKKRWTSHPSVLQLPLGNPVALRPRAVHRHSQPVARPRPEHAGWQQYPGGPDQTHFQGSASGDCEPLASAALPKGRRLRKRKAER